MAGEIDKPIRAGDPIRAPFFEELRKAVKKILRVAAPLQLTETTSGLFLSSAETDRGIRIAKTDSDGITARAALKLGKGFAYLYSGTADSSFDVTIDNNSAKDRITVYSFLSDKIAAQQYILVSWSKGIGWMAISSDCSQTD